MDSKTFYCSFFILICSSNTLASYMDPCKVQNDCNTKEIKNCTAPGLLCESCIALVNCIKVGEDQYKKANLQICDDGEKCSQQKCTSDPDPFCDGTACLQFPCTSVGVFPDPFYCNKYVMCVEITSDRFESYVIECEEGWGYNITKKECDVKLVNGICDTTKNNYPVPLCMKPGQNAALVEDPTMFYICESYDDYNEILYPKLFQCENGWVYVDYECRDPNA